MDFTTIEFQISFLLFVALAGYLLASRINQSAVIGEIIVGLIIGPSLLGWITYTDFVRSIAHLGAIILLFAIGLEFKMKEIYTPKYAFIAAVGIIVPWVGGFLTARAFGYGFPESVFIGTALTATSIAITANVLKEMDRLDTQAAKAVIGAAVIDDVLSLLALSISRQIALGEVDVFPIAVVLLKAGTLLVVGTLIGYYYLSPKLTGIDRMQISRAYPEFVFIAAMMMAFFYSAVAELIGLSAIVGAFIAGVSLEGIELKHSRSLKEGAEYLYIIFASIFFVSLGILANLKEVTSGVISFLLVLILVAVLTKFVGCYVSSRIIGLSNRDSLIVGFGMAPRGEVAMIVALIGLSEGLIGQDLYVVIVMMSLITTMITPMVLRAITPSGLRDYGYLG